MKKRILIIIFIISLIIPINYTYANTEEETIASQQDEFKIDEFITKSKDWQAILCRQVKIFQRNMVFRL